MSSSFCHSWSTLIPVTWRSHTQNFLPKVQDICDINPTHKVSFVIFSFRLTFTLLWVQYCCSIVTVSVRLSNEHTALLEKQYLHSLDLKCLLEVHMLKGSFPEWFYQKVETGRAPSSPKDIILKEIVTPYPLLLSLGISLPSHEGSFLLYNTLIPWCVAHDQRPKSNVFTQHGLNFPKL